MDERERLAEQLLAEQPLRTLEKALDNLKGLKPEKRSEKARRYSIVITELEKVIAYYNHFVLDA